MKYSASSDEEDKRKGGQEKAERRECVGWAHLSCLDRLVPHLVERDIVKREEGIVSERPMGQTAP